MIKSVSIRELRDNLAALLDKVAAGKQVIITRRGKPVARIIREAREERAGGSRYPLRGSVRSVSHEFDAPLEGWWEALES